MYLVSGGQWRIRGGQVERDVPIHASFGGRSTHFAIFEKCVFKQKFRPKYA